MKDERYFKKQHRRDPTKDYDTIGNYIKFEIALDFWVYNGEKEVM